MDVLSSFWQLNEEDILEDRALQNIQSYMYLFIKGIMNTLSSAKSEWDDEEKK